MDAGPAPGVGTQLFATPSGAAVPDRPLSPAALRHAFGQYPTGVAIVAARADDGSLIAMTINSFASLSLEPPLVLWSLSKRSADLPAYRIGRPFSISILAARQIALARHFADGKLRREALPGAMIEHPSGVPLIGDAVAQLLCNVEQTLPAGDHMLIIGRVVQLDTAPGDTLAFHRGRYARLASA
ncbi:flavin reductase family protein [Stenotrophomonas rhizophila]|uniref:flavin reductase family protein n=1 Tax=Stenotrophomonas rhizophila TaxID=216778 RepID=UPI001E62D141|nr:flavin reductase family protein [Stenotrophomonas rhizophila]MCC7635876.1 flavin reductase family protein [Stenotrophomonas rhizophila]MCC7665147.1 flavin reductase family protein [Stenotrophomonas rhizophila]